MLIGIWGTPIQVLMWENFPAMGWSGYFHWGPQCVFVKKLKELQQKHSITWRDCVFKEIFLEVIEIDNMSFETLHISVLMKAKFCYGCLAWKNDFLFASHSYLMSNISGRKQFYICRVYKRNQQDSAHLFSSRVGVIYWNLFIYVCSWDSWFTHTCPKHPFKEV